MAKKQVVKNFDELKNPDLEYRYSRAERLKEHGRPIYKKPESKGLAKFFGGNKMVATMVVFYIILGVFIFGYFSLYEQAESQEYKQSFSALKGQNLHIKLITNSTKYGLNVTLENKSKTDWPLKGFTIILPGYSNDNNLLKTLTPGEFDALFYNLPTNISNLIGLKVVIKGATNEK